MQISVIVVRKICCIKGHFPYPCPLKPVMSLLGDHCVATEELGGRFAAGLITHSPGFLRQQLDYFGD